MHSKQFHMLSIQTVSYFHEEEKIYNETSTMDKIY